MEDMPQPEATPSRIQQREFAKDFRVPEQNITMIRKDSVDDSDPDDSTIID